MNSFSCRHCEKEIAPDPVFQVDCPVCDASVGEKCRRPSGHVVWTPKWEGLPKGVHPRRDLKALAEGKYGTCPLGRCPEDLKELEAKKGNPLEQSSSERAGSDSQLHLFA